MGNALGAADDGEGRDHEPDFNLGPVDDMREALGGGGDGGMLGAGADVWLIPNNVDFTELAALHPSELPGAAVFNPVGSAAEKLRRVCELGAQGARGGPRDA